MAELRGEPLHILLVEDNESHAELVIRSMRDQQVANQMHHVTDGEKALDYLFGRGDFADPIKNPRPNLILLDLRLPRIDGLEVLKTIKTTPELLRIPVVILTSSDAESDIAKSYDYHANSYIVKPLDFKTFTRLMRDLGFYWLGWNTKPLEDCSPAIRGLRQEMDTGTGITISHILILEDDISHRDLILRAFGKVTDRFRVSCAGTIRDARDIIGRDLPDLIIADWILPDGKGIEILVRRGGVVMVPLIIMTSHGDERLAVEIMKCGAIDYVVKSATTFRNLPHIASRALQYRHDIQVRERAEEDALDSQKRLADIISFLPDAVLAIDNDGRVIAWNRMMEQMTGIAAENMLGKGDHEYSLPFYGERRPILIDLVFENKPLIEKKYVYVTRDGRRITSETYIPTLKGGKGAFLWGTASPLFDSKGNRIGAIEVIRDLTEWKHNEEILHRREVILETLLNAPRDTIALLDRQGLIVNINKEGAQRLGFSVRDITGKCAYDLLPPDIAITRKAQIDRVFESGRPAMFDDERTGMSIHNEVYPIFNTKHTTVDHIAIFATDITDRKRAEAALRESEGKFRSMVDTSPDIIWEVDRQGNFTYISSQCKVQIGYAPQDLIGKPFLILVQPGSVPAITTLFFAHMKEENSFRTLEVPAVRRDGSLCTFEIRSVRIPGTEGHLTRFQGIARDITEQKRAEEVLLQNQSRLATAMDVANLVNWEFDVSTGFFSFDDRFYSLYGTTAEREGGCLMPAEVYLKEFVHPEDIPYVTRVIGEVASVTDPDYSMELEHRIIRRDGQIRYLVVHFGVVMDSTGRVIRTYGANQDITDRKMMEEEIRSLNMVLEQRVADRTMQLNAMLTEKELLLREIHHRVKNNLQIIVSLFNLQSRYISDQKVGDVIRDCQSRVRAMALVHERIYRSENVTSVDLKEYFTFLGEQVFNYHSVKPSQINFCLTMPEIRLDVDTVIPLGLVVNELLSNSLKHAFPDGRKGTISILCSTCNEDISLSFSDDGVGFPAGLDWKNSPSLGLRLVRSLVRQLNGEIELEPSPGTTFRITVTRLQAGIN